MRPEPYEEYRTDRVFDALEALEREAVDARDLDGRPRAGVAARAPEVTAIVVGPGRAEHLEPAREALGSISLTADRDH